MCSPDMFIRKTCPVAVMRSVFSSLLTKPEPSSSGCRSGLESTSKSACDGASMVRWTVIRFCSVMGQPCVGAGRNSRRAGPAASEQDQVVAVHDLALVARAEVALEVVGGAAQQAGHLLGV